MLDEVLHGVAPVHARFVFQLRRLDVIAMGGVSQGGGERRGKGETRYLALGDMDHELDGREIVGEGEVVLHEFEEREAGGPDVRADRVLEAGEALRLVKGSAHVRWHARCGRGVDGTRTAM